MDVEFGGTAARAPSGGAAQVFSFRDCRLTVKTKGGSRALLKGVTGEARSGEVLAIMGPSGAGKTCLINMLTLTTGPGIASGDVMLNGRPFTRSMFVQLAGEVPQHDNHWAFLTCRETVQLAVVRSESIFLRADVVALVRAPRDSQHPSVAGVVSCVCAGLDGPERGGAQNACRRHLEAHRARGLRRHTYVRTATLLQRCTTELPR